MDVRNFFNGNFDQHVVLVTGAGQGLGAAIALELGHEGAAVISTDINVANAQNIADQIVATGGRAIAAKLDTTVVGDHQSAIAAGIGEFGKLTLVVNNAGIGDPAEFMGEMDLAKWDRMINVNLNGVAFDLRYQIPALMASGGGAIVNLTSILGTVGFLGVPTGYVAAKHGVVGLTNNSALEYGREGIRTNSVGPASIDTPLMETLPPEAIPAIIEKHPMGRLGEPEEVSALVCFLLSDRASFLTGGYHLVDGGYTAQ